MFNKWFRMKHTNMRGFKQIKYTILDRLNKLTRLDKTRFLN